MLNYIQGLTGVAVLWVSFLFAGAGCAHSLPTTHARLAKYTSADAAPSRVRLDYDALFAPLPIVYVSINHHVPLPFLLDTGSSSELYITHWAARKLGLHVSDQTTVLVTNTNEVVPLIHVNDVAFVAAPGTGKLPIHIGTRSKEATITDWAVLDYLLAGQRVAGVIGAPMFATETIQLDFDAHTLSLLPPASPWPATSAAITLPLRKHDDLFWVMLHDRQNQTVDAVLDTGSQNMNLLASQAAALGALKTSQESWVTTFGEMHRVQAAILPALQLGSLTVPDVVAVYPTDDKGEDDATLSMNVLARFRVTISFAHRQLMLEPAAGAASRSGLPGRSMVEVVLRNHRFVVEKVLPGSAAEQAGVHTGDQLLEVDQMPVGKIPYVSIQDAVDGSADTEAELMVEHAGQARRIRYHRDSLAGAVQHEDVGLGQ